MINHSSKTEPIQSSSFSVYVDLFDKGDFNEMNITCQAGQYQINIDDIYLGTIARRSDNSWEVVNGTIPSHIMPHIISKITRSLEVN